MPWTDPVPGHLRAWMWRRVVWLARVTRTPLWMFDVFLPSDIGMRRYTRVDGRGEPVTLAVPAMRREAGS